MNLTNILLAVIAALLCLRFFPDVARPAFALGLIGLAIYGCYWLVAVYPSKRREAKAARQQEADNNAEYNEYKAKHKAIRAKYDPNHEWNEATFVPKEYEEEIAALNREYRPMLIDRYGSDYSKD